MPMGNCFLPASDDEYFSIATDMRCRILYRVLGLFGKLGLQECKCFMEIVILHGKLMNIITKVRKVF